MSKVEIRQKHRIHELEAALRPFAFNVPGVKPDLRAAEGTDAIWLYCGTEGHGQEPPHLRPGDFTRARQVMKTE